MALHKKLRPGDVFRIGDDVIVSCASSGREYIRLIIHAPGDKTIMDLPREALSLYACNSHTPPARPPEKAR